MSEIRIKVVTAEIELEEDALEMFRRYRAIPMTMQYLGEGAQKFYDAIGDIAASHMYAHSDKYSDFFSEYFGKDIGTKSITIVSLGCGNAAREMNLLQYLHSNGADYTYYGVDSSMSMLELSSENLSQAGLDSSRLHLMCADFGSPRFIREIKERTKHADICVFAFLGGTIGNIEQDYLVDTTADLMRPGDILWSEISVRHGTTTTDDARLFERYKSYAENTTKNELDFLPLKNIGLSQDTGRIVLEMKGEENLKSLRFNFMFHLSEDVTITYKGHGITLLADTEILLFTVRVYDPDGFKNFIQARHFSFMGESIQEGVGLFLFQKE